MMITAGWFAVNMVAGMCASLFIGWLIGYGHGRRVGIMIGRYESSQNKGI